MTSFERLSYIQSNEQRHPNDISALANPCKNLVDVFNSISEEIDPGNLRVYLRLRPLVSEDSIINQGGNIEIIDDQNILLTAPSSSHAFKNKQQGITRITQKFKFSHVYNQETSQETLFEETTEELVNDLVKGQNCLLFSYGATNSGKTYTIQGTKLQPGLLPQTLAALFKTLGNQQYKGNDLKPQHFCGVVRLDEKQCQEEEEYRDLLFKKCSSFSRSYQSFDSRFSISSKAASDVNDVSTDDHLENSDLVCLESTLQDSSRNDLSPDHAFYVVYISFVEIYNEYIYDLLNRNSFSKSQKKCPLVLGEDRHGAIYIKGLKEIQVKNTEEALRILEIGHQNLHFAATRLNHHSSRSHCIFTIKLIRLADPLHPNFARVSMLSLCDLAGAERAGKTLNSMDRLKEASNINTSLLVLGRCMAALRHNQSVSKQVCGGRKSMPIPYRDSKVTRLFQPFFMGKGKVSMIVNISMATALFDETLKVLKFSALARKILNSRDKSFFADQIVEEGQKVNSQFSKFMHQSLNLSGASSARSSIPWHCRSFADVTFGGGEAASKDGSKLLSVPEETDDIEEDTKYEALLDLITKLKDKLVKECKEKVQLENKLRNEICDAFSQRIVQIEDSWRNRLEEERNRAEDLMDCRLKNILDLQNNSGSRKRLRQDIPHEEEMGLKEHEDEKLRLEEELSSLKEALKASTKAVKCCQEEKSKLIFELATSSKLLEDVTKEKEELETLMNQPLPTGSQTEILDERIIRELQLQLQNTKETLQTKKQELKNMADMLEEAAEEFIKKERTIANLKESLNSASERQVQHLDLITDLELQLSEAKHLLDTRTRYLEEREQEIYEMQSQQNAKEQIGSDDEVCNEAKNNHAEREMEDLRVEMEKIKIQLEKEQEQSAQHEYNYAEISACSSQKEKCLEEEKKALEDQLEALTQELSTSKRELNLENIKVADAEKDKIHLQTLKHDLNSNIVKCESVMLENEELKENLKMKMEEMDLIQNEKKKLQEVINKLEMNEKTLKEMLEITTNKEDKFEKELNAVKQKFIDEIEKGKEENNKLSIKLGAIEKEREETKKLLLMELEELREELKMNQSKMTFLSKDSKQMELLLSERCKEVEDLNEVLTIKKQIEESLWNDLDTLRKEHDKSKIDKEECLRLEEECDLLRNDVKMKTQQFAALTSQNSDLKEKKRKLEERVLLFEKDFQNLNESEKSTKREVLLVRDELQLLKDINSSMHHCIKAHYQSVGSLFEKWLINNAAIESFDISKESIHSLMNIEYNRMKKLSERFQELEEVNEKTKLALTVAEHKKSTTTQELDRFLTEYEDLKHRLTITQEEVCELSSLKSKLNVKNEELMSRLQNHQTTILNLSSKNEALDRKINTVESEQERFRTQYQLMEKETAALREARAEEVGQLQADLEHKESLILQKDREITTLQREIKRAMHISVASEATTNTTSTTSNIKEETIDWQSVSCLHNDLGMSEAEESSTHLPPSVRPPEAITFCLSEQSQSNGSQVVSFSTPAKSYTSAVVETPVPTRSTRRTRANSQKKSSQSHTPSTRSLRNTTKICSYADEDNEEETGVKCKQNTRGRARRPASRLPSNPHIEDKENAKLPVSEQMEDKFSSESKRSKRRPLYNLDVEEPFDTSPNLLTVREITQDSPHSSVKRSLRRVLKRH